MDELRCRFFGDEEGEVVAVAATGGGDSLVGGASNGSGGVVPSSDGVSMMSGLGEAWTLVEVWREV